VSVTERVLAELTGVRVTAGCCRRAELVGVLRFAGQLHPMGGRMVVVATVGSLAAAVRVQRGLREVYGCRADVLGPDSRPLQVNTGTPPRGTTAAVGRHSGGHRVLITTGGAELARRTGLLDRAGRGLRGVPPQLVAGRVCDVAALWRGAFLTQGGLSGPGRRAELTVTCPSVEVAMALVGAARRLGVPARSKEPCGQPQVFVRDLDGINTLLSAMGVREMLSRWYQPPARAGVATVEAFGESNLRRAQAAAERACAGVQDALRILGDRVPAHLAAAAALRLAHPGATLEELGQRYADPPMTKDAVAGRIRRLLQLAERTPDPRTTGSTGQRTSGRARTLTTTTTPVKDGAP
jgi:DNA-binding protein WhiA